MDTTPESRSALRGGAIIAACVLAGLMTVWLAAWGIDTAITGDSTRRNVAVLDAPVGGLDPQQLAARIGELSRSYDTTAVEVQAPGISKSTDAATAGLSLDVDGTIAAVDAVDNDVSALARPVVWLTSWFTTTHIPAVMQVDAPTLARSPLASIANDTTVAATEPSATAGGPALVVVPGSDGSAVSLNQLADELRRAAEHSQTDEVRVIVEPLPLPPRFSDADAQALVDLVNVSLRQPITVVTGSVTTQVEGASVANWLTVTPGDDGLELGVDPQRVIDGLAAINTVDRPEVPVGFAVVDGAVTTSPGTGVVVCCEPASTSEVIQAITTPGRTATLTMIESPLIKNSQWAAALGINQPVGSFTTNYPAGQDRAINIVRIAEIIRGTVIEPGTTFSVNETTGPRTEAQGFVPGGIIVNGKLSTGVGGGISQFATTLFNAAFFAGLDIPNYMMHTLYISRYPYGREATLAWPTVDLKITNTTPYGILIWTESTPESITVTLYSTPWVVGDQTGQIMQEVGACTKVTTERTRTWFSDNRTQTDVFIGRYQPEEGVLC